MEDLANLSKPRVTLISYEQSANSSEIVFFQTNITE